MGCSSNSIWVKKGSSTYDTNELGSAMVSCDYKAKMRMSNKLIMKSGKPLIAKVLSSEKDKHHLNEQIERKNEKIVRANTKQKQKSMDIGSAAYSCMKDKGFEKK